MKKSSLLFFMFAALIFAAAGVVYADCSAAFDHGGACGRNCMAANPSCGIRGCMSLCVGGAGAAATGNTVVTGNTATVAAVAPAAVTAPAARAAALTPGTAGAFNRTGANRNGGVNRVGRR